MEREGEKSIQNNLAKKVNRKIGYVRCCHRNQKLCAVTINLKTVASTDAPGKREKYGERPPQTGPPNIFERLAASSIIHR